MTDKELVELLRKMLPPKVLYGDLIGAEGVYAHSGPLVWEDMESYVISEAADRIEQLRAELTNEIIDNTNLIGELATVAAERDRYKAEHENLRPPTNADRIREMSDEELAITLMCPNEMGMAEIPCDHSDDKSCYECLLKWLQQPAEEAR